MERTLADARRWVAHGTHVCRDAIASLDEASFAQTCLLPGWTRKHLVAHLAANGDAVRNLATWAATGVPTPMYSSPAQRSSDIEAGSQYAGSALTAWFDRSAQGLQEAWDGLSASAWQAPVVTAQGRTVPASETPWMRAREVLVHAVDLGTGVTFADLPSDFLEALGDDITTKRGAAPMADSPVVEICPTDATGVCWTLPGSDLSTPITVAGPLAACTAYLAGRGDAGLTANRDGERTPIPSLAAWL